MCLRVPDRLARNVISKHCGTGIWPNRPERAQMGVMRNTTRTHDAVTIRCALFEQVRCGQSGLSLRLHQWQLGADSVEKQRVASAENDALNIVRAPF